MNNPIMKSQIINNRIKLEILIASLLKRYSIDFKLLIGKKLIAENPNDKIKCIIPMCEDLPLINLPVYFSKGQNMYETFLLNMYPKKAKTIISAITKMAEGFSIVNELN